MPAMIRDMRFNRRHLLMSALPVAALLPLTARAAPQKAYGIDAMQFGVRPNAADDQSGALQRAINRAAQLRVPLILGPGRYRAGGLTLPEGVQIAGVRGATRLVFTRGPSLLAAEGAANLTLTGLTLDGGGARLPESRGLLHLNNARNLRIAHCEIINRSKIVILQNFIKISAVLLYDTIERFTLCNRVAYADNWEDNQ